MARVSRAPAAPALPQESLLPQSRLESSNDESIRERIDRLIHDQIEFNAGFDDQQRLQAEAAFNAELGLALKEPQEELDKPSPPTIVVAYKQQSMEDLELVLERALAMARNPSSRRDEVIGYTREQLELIQNPHLALEREWENLVRAGQPPNGKLYSLRPDKNVRAVDFFLHVYGRFYKAGLVYKHQLRLLDPTLLNNLGHHAAEIHIKTKKDYNTAVASKVLGGTGYIQSAVLSVLTRKSSRPK